MPDLIGGVPQYDATSILGIDVDDTDIADGKVLQYNSTSGNLEYETPSGGGISNVVDDTTPQLGGDLDVNGNSIVSVSNGDINITPNGTGNVSLGNFTLDADQSVGAGQDNYVLTYDNGTGLISLEAASGGGGASTLQEAFDGGQSITIADTDNQTLSITNNDVTNSPNSLFIDHNLPSGGSAIDIDAETTTGIGVRMDFGVLTNGSGLYAYSNSASTTDTGVSGIAVVFQDNASATGRALFVRMDGTGRALDIDQNGNREAFRILANTTSSSVFQAQAQGSMTGGAKAFQMVSSVAQNHAGAIASVESTNSSTTAEALFVLQNGSGEGIIVDHNGANWAYYADHDDTGSKASMYIDRDGNNASRIHGIRLDVDNAGAGGVGGIDFTNFSLDEPLFSTIADAITSAGTVSHQIPVNIGGTIYYLVAHTHGS